METIDEIFKKQIRREARFIDTAGDSPSFVSYMAYKITEGLDIDDWRVIRSGDYYDVCDKLKGINRDKFVINRVNNYLKQRR